MMKTPDTNATSRLDREIEREREQRVQNDEAKSGNLADEEFRVKDARYSTSSGQLNRSRGR